MNELALFAGAGGGILGGHLLGWRTVCAVEFDPYAAGVLLARQDDGTLPPFPIWNDIRTFDGRPWAGLVDVISGGFPCQDISCAGKGAGIEGERSGLWGEMFRVVREVGPRFVFVENSPMLTSRGLGRVLGDLASVGYDAEWMVLGADDVGAPHRRERIWILADSRGGRLSRTAEREIQLTGRTEAVGTGDEVAYAAGHGRSERRAESAGRQRGSQAVERGSQMADAPGERCGEAGQHRRQPEERSSGGRDALAHPNSQGLQITRRSGQAPGTNGGAITATYGGRWWEVEPHLGGVVDGLASGVDIHGTHAGLDVGRVATGVPSRVGRLKAIGNGQVPLCAATAFRILSERLPQ